MPELVRILERAPAWARKFEPGTGYLPIHLAAAANQTRAVQFFLEHDKSLVRALSRASLRTPLHAAAQVHVQTNAAALELVIEILIPRDRLSLVR